MKSITTPVIVAVSVVFVTSGVFWLRSERSIEKYYADRLQLLEKTLQELPLSFEISEDIESDLNRYDQKLAAGMSLCQEMVEKKQALSGKTLPDEVRSLINDTDSLCADLSGVMRYSRALYSALGPYITLHTTDRPSTGDQQFEPWLDSLQSVISHTLKGLQKTDSAGVHDPGRPELISQVELTRKYASDAQSALARKDAASVRQNTDMLIKEITQDRKDFLNSRYYFWHNTVQLDALLETVRKIQGQFDNKH